MSVYYATKTYVLSLTEGLREKVVRHELCARCIGYWRSSIAGLSFNPHGRSARRCYLRRSSAGCQNRLLGTLRTKRSFSIQNRFLTRRTLTRCPARVNCALIDRRAVSKLKLVSLRVDGPAKLPVTGLYDLLVDLYAFSEQDSQQSMQVATWNESTWHRYHHAWRDRANSLCPSIGSTLNSKTASLT